MEINVKMGKIKGIKGYDAIVNFTKKSISSGPFKSFDKKNHVMAGFGPDWKYKNKVNETWGCEQGKTIVTDAYQLPYKHIIYTVAPTLKEDGMDWWALEKCYHNVLEEAVKNGDRNIAIPATAIKNNGLPKKETVEVAVRTVVSFCNAYSEHFDQITFVLNKDEKELEDYYKVGLHMEGKSHVSFIALQITVTYNEEAKVWHAIKSKSIIPKHIHIKNTKWLRSILNQFKFIRKMPFKITSEGIVIEKCNLTINPRDISLIKVGKKMRVTIDIDKLQLDDFLKELLDIKKIGNSTLSVLLNVFNDSTSDEAKYELIQSLLKWMNKNNLSARLFETCKQEIGENKILTILEDLELQLDDVQLFF